MLKLLLPVGLVLLTAFGGLPVLGRATGRALPLVTSQPKTAAGTLSGLPDSLIESRPQLRHPQQSSESSTAPNLRFDCLSAADGMSFSLSQSLLQDQRGFMWFGTGYGLNKYDGFNFTIYTLVSGEDVLASNSISRLYQDRAGNLWIGTAADLVRRDMKTGEFTHYKPDAANPQSLLPGRINTFGEDSSGALWIGTNGGLNRYEPATDTFTRYFENEGVLSFLVDSGGGTWLGTAYGLLYFSPGTLAQQNPVRYRIVPEDQDSAGGNVVNTVFQDQQGAVWAGTQYNGLNRLDRTTGQFTRFLTDPDDPYSLSHNRVWSIKEDDRGRLWIGTMDGLNLFDRAAGRFYRYYFSPGDPHSLSNDTVWDIYQDHSGVVWFGTTNGVCKVNDVASRFTHYQQGPNQPDQWAGVQPGYLPGLSDNIILSVYHDSHGILWVGTSAGGLNRLDRRTGSLKVYQYDRNNPDSLYHGAVNAILEDRAENLWIGTNGGLDRFNPQTEAFEKESPEGWGGVSSIAEDQQGNLWVGYDAGIRRRKPGDSSFTPLQSSGDLPALERIQAIYPDRRGAVWFSSQNHGLFRLDPAAEGGSAPMIIHFPQDPNDPKSPGIGPVLSFYEDAQGTLWMGSIEDGLVRFDRASQTFTHYIPAISPARYVHCVQGDAKGFLWVNTKLGLARFDPRTETFVYFDARDGLVAGVGYRCFQNEQGEMFFASWSGLNTFFPDQISDNANPPPVVITALNLRNQPLRTDLLPDEQIKLSYRENYLSFDFAALDYAAPAKNQYAYKVEGLDADWIEAGTRRHADYPDLRPGTYIFRVKASNNSGVWNEEGAAVHIVITPPFWQTWWFLALLSVALLGVVAGGIRLRIKGVEARSRDLEAQVASRTGELVALNEIATVLNRPLDLQGVLGDALEKTLKVTRIEAGGIYLLDEKTQVLTIAAHQGFSPQFVSEIDGLQAGEGFSGLVIRSGETLVVRDVSADPRLTRMVVRDEGFHSLAVVPLKSRDQVRGTLFALTHGHREFTDQDVQLLESIGHQVGAAIESARLYEDTKNQVAQLNALQETTKAVASTLELDSLLNLIIQQATALLQADGGFINLVDRDRRVDEVVAVAGLAPPVVGERIPLEASLSGWATLHNQATISNQIPNDDRVARTVRSWVMENHIQSAAVAPLSVRDQVMGTLVVIGQEGKKGRFVQSDLDQLVAFANQAAIAIENARLYEQSRELAVIEERGRLARELHDAVTQTLFSASLVAEALPTTWERDTQEGRGLLQELRGLCRGALAEMRTLLLELRPARLMETRLDDLLRQLGEAASGREGIPVAVQVEGRVSPLPPDVHIALYRITQEALNNVVKHARARRAEVRLRYGGDTPTLTPPPLAGEGPRVLLSISDDGRGFDPARVPHDRLGLGNMQERAQAIGAALTIESQPGHGTQITVLWETESET